MPSKKDRFVFRKHSNIGAADAIEDKKFLFDSFVDNGELDILLDQFNPKCIIAGRTGSGKTALIEVIKKSQERVISIAPEGLALNFLTNNNSIRFFLETGVDLDLFYRLLWRHVFAVEIIKKHYKIKNKEARDSFLVRIKDYFSKHRTRKEAIEYLT